ELRQLERRRQTCLRFEKRMTGALQPPQILAVGAVAHIDTLFELLVSPEHFGELMSTGIGQSQSLALGARQPVVQPRKLLQMPQQRASHEWQGTGVGPGKRDKIGRVRRTKSAPCFL